MLNSILANVIAGLGLFFSGLRLIDGNLRQATGRRLRAAVGRITRNRWLAGTVGVLTGALLQSTSAIVFILVSLVASGLTTVRRVLPIVTWANVGCCALVFAAVLDLRLAILYLLGLAGAAFAFDRSHRTHALSAIFGVGMLFYGVELMKIGAELLKQLPWFAGMLEGGGNSLLFAFVGASAFSFVTQSSTAASVLIIGLAQTGLFGAFPAMSALYGANLGSTFSRMLLSSGLRGSVRQLAAFQDLFKITGTVIFVVLLYIEKVIDVPLVLALVRHVSQRIDRQMALVFLLFNVGTAVIFTLGQSWIHGLLERRYPVDDEEDLSKPQFLYDEAVNEPSTALDLVEQEQLRLAGRLRLHPSAMRGAPGSPVRVRALALHKPFGALAEQIEHFQQALVDQRLGTEETERLTMLQNRLSLILYLEDSLRSMTSVTAGVVSSSRLGDLVSTFVEGLDFVLTMLVSALETGDREQIELLVKITEDRGDLMEQIRQNYLAEEGSVDARDRAVLLQVTNLFERTIWMTQRLARLLGRNARTSAETGIAPVESSTADLLSTASQH
jgi:phosphate:Na+ symporter